MTQGIPWDLCWCPGDFLRLERFVFTFDALLAFITPVRFLKSILVVLVALAWLPMTMHCRLESVPGLEFLACLTEGDCHTEQSSDRSDDDCCSVEKSDYRISQTRLTLPAVDLVPLCSTPVLDVANALPDEVSVGVLTAAPPEFFNTWHFVFRAALPVRAPSIAS